MILFFLLNSFTMAANISKLEAIIDNTPNSSPDPEVSHKLWVSSLNKFQYTLPLLISNFAGLGIAFIYCLIAFIREMSHPSSRKDTMEHGLPIILCSTLMLVGNILYYFLSKHPLKVTVPEDLVQIPMQQMSSPAQEAP